MESGNNCIMTQTQLPVLTVSQLTQAIKLCLESNFSTISLQGEISNCKLQSSGHLYFSLKDSKAQISAVMFRGDVTALKHTPKDGDQVVIKGELNLYPPSGKYQIVVKEMQLAGLGELLLKLEELKVKLLKKGYFRSDHKKPLPRFPKTIGVVTSPTGAVIQDILNVLTRRAGNFHLILNPVKVQGPGAAEEIALAIEQFNRYKLADLLIVGRGGGSLEDLWAFNEEIVADAIYNSKIPIISAVGHETDHCIADYVADVRAPTPSAAAEIAIGERSQLLQHLLQMRQRLQHSVQHLIKQSKFRLSGITRQPLFTNPYALLGPWLQQLDDYRQKSDELIKQQLWQKRLLLDARKKQLQTLRPHMQINHLKQMLFQKREQIEHAWLVKLESRKRLFQAEKKRTQLDQYWERRFQSCDQHLKKLVQSLHSVDPKNLLKRGYCILFAEKDGSVITSLNAITLGQEVEVLLADGRLRTEVKELIRDKNTAD